MSHKQKNNIFLVVLFGICVTFLILVSLIIKAISIVNSSTYSSNQRYTLLILDDSDQAIYLSVSEPDKVASKLVIYSVDGSVDLPVGVDGIVTLSSTLEPGRSPGALISEILVKRNEQRIGVSVLDLIRMYFAFRTTPQGNQTTLSASSEEDVTSDVRADLYFDTKIIDEDKTISIENASSQAGVATKLENVLTALGANVISVETAVNSGNSRIITMDEESYTVKKIHRMLGYPIEIAEDQQISDVSIIIGEDGFGNFVFLKE